MKRLSWRRVAIGLLVVGAVWFALLGRGPLFEVPYSRVLYSADGRLLGARVAADEQWRFPPSDSTVLPLRYLRALIEFEDRRFYRHPGVSLPSVVRAATDNAIQGRRTSGASTLTMQLVRLSRGNPPRTVSEKISEMITALRLEWSYNKSEIVALYAAHAPFGGNVVGVEAAAWRYFERPLDELTWAEAATLAVLPNAPGLIRPGRSEEELRHKRNRLLNRLLQTNDIDSTDYLLAIDEPLPTTPAPLPAHAPHLLERGGGVTTLDGNLQVAVQQIVDNYGRSTLAPNHISNAAAIVAEIETGRVLAYVGNITSTDTGADDGRAVDVVQARRSTGSLLKPLLYCAMVSAGEIMPEALVFDTPLNMAGFTPSNYNRTFSGVVTAREAIERSLNVPVVRMLRQYNISRFLEHLRALGMTTLPYGADHYGATLVLGGAEGSLWEMAGIYASLGRAMGSVNRTGSYAAGDLRGLTLDPTRDGTLPPRADATLSKIDPGALWFTLEAMSGVNRPEEEASWQVFSTTKQVAWKTGTSYGNRDAWAVGITPRYVVGVWVGNANGAGRASMTGVGSAAPVMFDIFALLPAAPQWFAKPLEAMEPTQVCRRSGFRASQWCGADPSGGIDTLDMPRVGLSTPVCPYHKAVAIEGRTVGWFVLPPAAEYYYRRRGGDYTPPPATLSGSYSPLEFIYPESGAVLYLPRGFNGREEFVFRAAHRDAAALIHWHIDQNYLGATRSSDPAGHARTTTVDPGRHTLTIVDDSGHRERISFTVRDR